MPAPARLTRGHGQIVHEEPTVDDAQRTAMAVFAVDAEFKAVIAAQQHTARRDAHELESLQRHALVEQLHIRLRAQVAAEVARARAHASRFCQT